MFKKSGDFSEYFSETLRGYKIWSFTGEKQGKRKAVHVVYSSDFYLGHKFLGPGC